MEDEFFEHNFGRDPRSEEIGGGVITDLAGFVAATFTRHSFV